MLPYGLFYGRKKITSVLKMGKEGRKGEETAEDLQVLMQMVYITPK